MTSPHQIAGLVLIFATISGCASSKSANNSTINIDTQKSEPKQNCDLAKERKNEMATDYWCKDK